jgi:hypothetical protein
MNHSILMSCIAGAMQFIVAGYALRLNRLFGTARVGWSLFAAFALLALLHLIQAVTLNNGAMQFSIEIEVIYSLISFLMLTGMLHMETLLKERSRLERVEQDVRSELESQVKQKTAHLTRAIEELVWEIDERKRVEAEIAKAQEKLLAASRQAGMAEVATGVLQNVGQMLASVDASVLLVSDQVRQSKIANVVHLGNLMREHTLDLRDFITHDPAGQDLPEFIAQLAGHLGQEQAALARELASLRKNLEQIGEIVALQQNFARLKDAPELDDATHLMEDKLRALNSALASREAGVFAA